MRGRGGGECSEGHGRAELSSRGRARVAGALATPAEAWHPGCSVPPDPRAAAAQGWQEAERSGVNGGLTGGSQEKRGSTRDFASGRAAQHAGGSESWGWAAAQIPVKRQSGHLPGGEGLNRGGGREGAVRQVLGVPLPLESLDSLAPPAAPGPVSGGPGAVGIPRGSPLPTASPRVSHGAGVGTVLITSTCSHGRVEWAVSWGPSGRSRARGPGPGQVLGRASAWKAGDLPQGTSGVPAPGLPLFN